MKNVLKISFVIIGTMIGAGFASGQEINLFFMQYGNIGILGMIVSCILTSFIIYQVFKILHKRNIHNYSEFLESISPHKKLNQIIQIIIHTFLLLSFYIMIAGFCAYFKQEFQIPIWASAIIITVLCYITFKNNMKGVVSINSFLIPFLIIFIFYLGLKNIPFLNSYFSQLSNLKITYTNSFNWIISSIIYASYNSILLIPILIELNEKMENKLVIKKVSIFCFAVFSILGVCLCGLLIRGNGYSHTLELPMIPIVKEFGIIYSRVYGIVIIAAIFTSAISAGYGFLKNVTKTDKAYQRLVVLLCISSIFTPLIGFSNLVNLLYPIFGLLGLIQIIQIIKNRNTVILTTDNRNSIIKYRKN
jgi:uncharacterized membrane protein YkvI